MPKSVPGQGPAPESPARDLRPAADAGPPTRSSRLDKGAAGDAPWASLVRDFADALALADGADQLEGELRRSVVTVAARRLRESAQRLGERMKDDS